MKIGERKDMKFNMDKGVFDTEDTYGVITTTYGKNLFVNDFVQKQDDELRIRKLTPREAWRLMGVKDEDFDKVKDKFSDIVLYHLAGDSIVTSCLMSIFGTMAEDDFNTENTINEKLLKGMKDEQD